MTLGAFGEWRHRAAGMMGDIRDHFPSGKPPERTTLSGDSLRRVREKLLPSELARELMQAAAGLRSGTWYECTTIAGKKERGTSHPHRFVVMRLPQSLQLIFLDPEHEVGRQSVIRPKVVNAMVAHLFQDRPNEVAIIRYRADDSMRMSDKGSVDRLSAQWKSAKDLIDRDGLPKELVGKENEIIYRAAVDAKKGVVQSRYITKEGIEKYAKHGAPTKFLESKEISQRAILKRFLGLLKEGAFRNVPEETL